MAKQQANQPSTLFKSMKTTVLTLLFSLFMLWLVSPFLIKQLVHHYLPYYLPTSWHISSLKVSRPGVDSLAFNDIQLLDNSGTRINITELIVPYRYQQNNWQIDTLSIALANEKTHNHSANEQLRQAPTFPDLPFDITINEVIFHSPKFSLTGQFNYQQNTIKFDGKLSYGQLKLPLLARFTKQQTAQTLALQLISGAQKLEASYQPPNYQSPRYQPTNHLQSSEPLSITLQLNQQILPIFNQLTNTQLPEMSLTNADLTLNSSLRWPENITDINSWYQALEHAEANLTFDDIVIPEKNLTISANQWQINWADQQLTLNQQQPTKLSYHITDSNTKLALKLDNQKPLVFDWQSPELTLTESPVVALSQETQQITLQPTNLTINTKNQMLMATSELNAKLTPNQLFKEMPDIKLGEFSLSGLLTTTFTEKKLTTTAKELTLKAQQAIAPLADYPILAISDLTMKSSDIVVSFDPQEQLNEKLIETLTLQGPLTFTAEISDQQLLNNCHWQWQQQTTDLSCKTKANALATNQLNSHVKIKNQQSLHYQLLANDLALTQWPVLWSSTINQLTSGAANLNLSGKLHLPISANLNWQQAANSLSKGSFIEISELEAVSYQQQLSHAQFHYQYQGNNEHHLTANISQLNNSSLPPLDNLSLDATVNHHQQTANGKLDFQLFGGHHQLTMPSLTFSQATQQAKWQIEALDINQLISWFDIKGLTASGKLSGTIPFTLSRDMLTIAQANLSATESGTINYLQPGDNTPFAEKNIAFQALEDFQYQELTLIDGEASLPLNAEGSYRFPMRIVGYNPKLYHGKSVAINPLISGSLPAKSLYYLFDKRALTQQVPNKK